MLGQKENQYESNENINTIDETIETIDLTTNQSSDNFSFTTNTISSNLPVSNNNKIVEIEAPVTIEVPVTKTSDVFITLVCYNKFEKPNKKLDGALAILFNPENIKTFEPKNKITHNLDEESNQSNSNSNKKIRTLETDSDSLTALNIIKKNIYDNLSSCSIHIQGCLISEDGRRLKLDKNIITASTEIMASTEITSMLRSITVHTKKKSLLKANIHITKDITFQNLLTFIFPNSPPNGKRFIIKSSLELDRKNFLPNQIISQVFVEQHTNIWIEIEDIEISFDNLFD
ncbi:hypothetical protein C2G38_2195068 [Gigaspora rosea]|uniref:Uncharacterized protein n=1 Tax=Gigaspora rosea TaxID=44941 RepID=A0A397UW61_9GLOM|nr:hypothetical protein C2G38_2195068 [Gigaspora rosea]